MLVSRDVPNPKSMRVIAHEAIAARFPVEEETPLDDSPAGRCQLSIDTSVLGWQSVDLIPLEAERMVLVSTRTHAWLPSACRLDLQPYLDQINTLIHPMTFFIVGESVVDVVAAAFIEAETVADPSAAVDRTITDLVAMVRSFRGDLHTVVVDSLRERYQLQGNFLLKKDLDELSSDRNERGEFGS